MNLTDILLVGVTGVGVAYWFNIFGLKDFIQDIGTGSFGWGMTGNLIILGPYPQHANDPCPSGFVRTWGMNDDGVKIAYCNKPPIEPGWYPR